MDNFKTYVIVKECDALKANITKSDLLCRFRLTPKEAIKEYEQSLALSCYKPRCSDAIVMLCFEVDEAMLCLMMNQEWVVTGLKAKVNPPTVFATINIDTKISVDIELNEENNGN